MMSRARLAIVGAGTMGAFHARSATQSEHAELVVVADVREGAAEAVASQVGCDATTDIPMALARDDLDGVIISTPMGSHVELIEQAATRGLAILCEKPLAPTLGDCAHAIAITEDLGVLLQVGFHRRFDPDWQEVHDAVSRGELGQVQMIKSTLRDMTPPPREYLRRSGGYFRDAFVHDFDAARWLGGEVASVTAVGTAISTPFGELNDFDNAVVVLHFVSGAIGVSDGSRLGGYGYDCTTEVLGSRGAMRIANPTASNVRRLHGGGVESGLPSTFLERFAHAYAKEVDGFARVLACDEVASGAGGRDALLALAIASAAELSTQRSETVQMTEILMDVDASVGRIGTPNGSPSQPVARSGHHAP